MSEQSISSLPLLNRKTQKVVKELSPKILQFGGGNFLRGFIDYMVQVLNEETDFAGSVIIVKPTERGDYAALKSQDGLFHVSMNGIKDGKLVTENKLVSCVDEVLHAYHEWDAFLKTAEVPSLRFIISNTTEAGIKVDEKDTFSEKAPHEFPAKLTRWLHHRFQHFSGSAASGCILLPCELIENNGIALSKCILQYADLWSLGEEFKKWVVEQNIFCNTLVDRIVPGFPTARKVALFQSIGFQDQLLVDAEPYHIFVIQSPKEIQAELPFSQTNLNVIFTDDLEAYRKLKVRILNGAHTSMVPVGYLSGIESVREAVEDEVMGDFIQKILFEEILPSLEFSEEVLEKYANDILDRFRNPFLHHRLISISLNSISKFKTRVLPSLLDFYQKKKVLPSRIVFSFASLLWFYRGKRGEELIPLNDDSETLLFFKMLWEKFDAQEISMEALVTTILEQEDFWEMDLNEVEGLRAQLVAHLSAFSAGESDFKKLLADS